MNLDDIKNLNLESKQEIHIKYIGPDKSLETRCGWFSRIVELPKSYDTFPDEYRHTYPKGLPIVEISYLLDKNDCMKEFVHYRPEEIRHIWTLISKK